MKKIIFLIFVLIIFLPSLNASEVDYSLLEHIEVLELPNPTQDTMDYIYDYDGRYYITNITEAQRRSIQVGDNLRNKTVFYDINNYSFVDVRDYYSNIPTHCYIGYVNNSLIFREIFDSSRFSFDFNNVSFVNDGHTAFFLHRSGNVSDLANNNIIFNNSADYIITSLDNDCYIKPSDLLIDTPAGYEWVEISYYDWFRFSTEDEDFYMFYTFEEISDFSIFSSYDFTSFTDFQKLIILIGINSFFCGFLGLCIYVSIKAINKIFTWITN